MLFLLMTVLLVSTISLQAEATIDCSQFINPSFHHMNWVGNSHALGNVTLGLASGVGNSEIEYYGGQFDSNGMAGCQIINGVAHIHYSDYEGPNSITLHSTSSTTLVVDSSSLITRDGGMLNLAGTIFDKQ